MFCGFVHLFSSGRAAAVDFLKRARAYDRSGLEYNALYGRSSNQELLTGSRSVPLKPDDYVFLRPTQSESVLLQFGDLVVYDEGAVQERWPTFAVSA